MTKILPVIAIVTLLAILAVPVVSPKTKLEEISDSDIKSYENLTVKFDALFSHPEVKNLVEIYAKMQDIYEKKKPEIDRDYGPTIADFVNNHHSKVGKGDQELDELYKLAIEAKMQTKDIQVHLTGKGGKGDTSHVSKAQLHKY